MKLYILLLSMIQSCTIIGMDYQALKKIQDNPSTENKNILISTSIPHDTSAASFLTAIENNDEEAVKAYLKDETFKEKVDSDTLDKAYILAIEKNNKFLRIGISILLRKLFPQRFFCSENSMTEKFWHILNENNVDNTVIKRYLDDPNFVDRTPLYYLKKAHYWKQKDNMPVAAQLYDLIYNRNRWGES